MLLEDGECKVSDNVGICTGPGVRLDGKDCVLTVQAKEMLCKYGGATLHTDGNSCAIPAENAVSFLCEAPAVLDDTHCDATESMCKELQYGQYTDGKCTVPLNESQCNNFIETMIKYDPNLARMLTVTNDNDQCVIEFRPSHAQLMASMCDNYAGAGPCLKALDAILDQP